MGTVAGLQLAIFIYFCVGSFLTVMLMCPLMDLVGKDKKNVTVTETRTNIDSGISYVERITKNTTTYQAEVQVSRDETVTADVSKEMFSQKPEQAILIQCQLDKTPDGERTILTNDENYDTTAIQKKLIEDGEKSVWHMAIASALLLFAVSIFALTVFSKEEKKLVKELVCHDTN